MSKTALLTALCLIAVNAQASWDNLAWLTQYQKPNIHIGQLALHPYYEFSEVYDSNIYLVPRDQANGVVVGGGHRESWIAKNDLGLEAVLPWHALHNLSLGYGLETQNYTTQPSVNNALNQSAHADYVYTGAYGVTVKAGDSFMNTNDPAFSELVARQRRWENEVRGSVDYNPENGRLAGGVDARQQNDKYLTSSFAQLLNRYEQDFGFNVGYKVMPKTKVFVAYHRGIIHYAIPEQAVTGLDKDSKSNTVSAGVDGQLAPKVEGKVEAGLTNRQYDVAPLAGPSRVYNAATVATAVTWKPDPYTTVVLGLSRVFQESINQANPFYYESLVSLDAKHSLPHKFKTGVRGSFGIDKYINGQVLDPTSTSAATGNRRDDLYQGEIWLTYDIQQWLSTGIDYLYRQRNSTLTAQFNYEDHIATWNLELKF